jgi:hypothetical protein
MIASRNRGLALVLSMAFALPLSAQAAGGAAAGGTGAAGTGSAAVGGGSPAGRVGGGPPTGQVGGGAPGSNDAASNGSAGTGNPSANTPAQVSTDNPASGLENAPTTNGVIGGTTGIPPKSVSDGGPAPSATGQAQPQPAVAPNAVRGIAEQPAPSTVGLAEPGPDGVSTRIVKPKPCGVAAHETDGTTTCVGIPTAR